MEQPTKLPDDKAVWRAIIVAVSVHAGALIGLLVFLTFKLPQYAEFFHDAEIELPKITRFYLSFSNSAKIGWPAFVLLLAADGGILFGLRRHPNRLPATVWSIAILLGVLAALGLGVVAMLLPMRVLMSQMHG